MSNHYIKSSRNSKNLIKHLAEAAYHAEQLKHLLSSYTLSEQLENTEFQRTPQAIALAMKRIKNKKEGHHA